MKYATLEPPVTVLLQHLSRPAGGTSDLLIRAPSETDHRTGLFLGDVALRLMTQRVKGGGAEAADLGSKMRLLT